MSARYIEIRDDILAKIKSGEYAPGETIPTEIELTKLYGVSRPTVRQALQMLVDEGYLDKRRRRGTIVRHDKIEQGFATRVRSFEEEMRSINRTARTTVISCTLTGADSEVASELQLEEGAQVLRLVRVRYVDSHPNVYVISFVPTELYPGIERVDFEHKSLYSSMRQMGNPVARARRKLDITLADRGTADILDIDEGAPLYVFRTVAMDIKNRPIEFSIATYNGETNSFEFDTAMVQSISEPLIG